MTHRGGRISGGGFNFRLSTWLLVSGLGGLVAIGWGLKPQAVTINNYSQPENALVIPWARNLPPLTIYVKPDADPRIIEATAARMRQKIERPGVQWHNTPAMYVSDCEDNPFFGTDQEKTAQAQLRHDRGELDAQVRTRALRRRAAPQP